MSSQVEMTQKEKSVAEYKLNFTEYKKNFFEDYVKLNYESLIIYVGKTWDEKVEEYNGCLSTTIEEFFIPLLMNEDEWNLWIGEADDLIPEGFDMEDEDDMEELWDMKNDCWGGNGKDISHLANWIEETGIQGLKNLLGLEENMLK